VDHPRRLDGDLAQRLGGSHGKRLEEVSGVSQVAPRSGFGGAEIYSSVDFAAWRRRTLAAMASEQRDSTEDWLLPEGRRPPTLVELEGRIDEALAVARAAESAAAAIGAAALEAAEQAREAAEGAHRSAQLADRATSAVVEERRGRAHGGRASEDRSMRSFSERADRVVARLRALERLPA
jgi:hypothetical protein